MNEHFLKLFLRVVGGFALLAFAAAVMPSKWMIEVAEELGLQPFPDHPLTFYLARNLSLLYGFVGFALVIVASDLKRYRPLVRLMAMGTILFAGLQLVVDSLSGMPAWWTWGESGSTLCGGILLFWLDRKTTSSDTA